MLYGIDGAIKVSSILSNQNIGQFGQIGMDVEMTELEAYDIIKGEMQDSRDFQLNQDQVSMYFEDIYN